MVNTKCAKCDGTGMLAAKKRPHPQVPGVCLDCAGSGNIYINSTKRQQELIRLGQAVEEMKRHDSEDPYDFWSGGWDACLETIHEKAAENIK